MKKARLIKRGSDAHYHNVAQSQSQRETPRPNRRRGRRAEERERRKESFNPPKVKKPNKAHLEKLDDSLVKALDKYQDSLNNPDIYTDKEQKRLRRKAKAYAKRIKEVLQAQNERTPDQRVVEFFYVDAGRARKKDCKLPKRTGYGLRVAAKNNNPKRGKAVLPIVNPAYVTARTSSIDKLPKHGRDRNTPHVGYIWEKPGHRRNGNED